MQRAVLGGVLGGGGDISRLSGRRDVAPSGSGALRYSLRGAWMTHAAYVDFARASDRGLSFELGVRASDSTLMTQRALTPWVLGAWRFAPSWTLNASAGASRQFADLDAMRRINGEFDRFTDLLVERARRLRRETASVAAEPAEPIAA